MIHAMILAAAVVTPPALPEWMAGCWTSDSEAEWVEECWSDGRGGMMLGTNKGAEADKPASWEMMQIGPIGDGGEIAFRASLRGSGWTPFTRKASDSDGMTFENAAHDYPQRIRYWREGETLRAEISRLDGSEPMQWTFRKIAR